MLTFLFILNSMIFSGPLLDALIELGANLAKLDANAQNGTKEATTFGISGIYILLDDGVTLSDYTASIAYLKNLKLETSNAEGSSYFSTELGGILNILENGSETVNVTLNATEKNALEKAIINFGNPFNKGSLTQKENLILTSLNIIKYQVTELPENDVSLFNINIAAPQHLISTLKFIYIPTLFNKKYEADKYPFLKANKFNISLALSQILNNIDLINKSSMSLIGKKYEILKVCNEELKTVEINLMMAKVYYSSLVLNSFPISVLKNSSVNISNPKIYSLFFNAFSESDYFNVPQFKNFLTDETNFDLLKVLEFNGKLASDKEYKKHQQMMLKCRFNELISVINTLINIKQFEIAEDLLYGLRSYQDLPVIQYFSELTNSKSPNNLVFLPIRPSASGGYLKAGGTTKILPPIEAKTGIIRK